MSPVMCPKSFGTFEERALGWDKMLPPHRMLMIKECFCSLTFGVRSSSSSDITCVKQKKEITSFFRPNNVSKRWKKPALRCIEAWDMGRAWYSVSLCLVPDFSRSLTSKGLNVEEKKWFPMLLTIFSFSIVVELSSESQRTQAMKTKIKRWRIVLLFYFYFKRKDFLQPYA